VSQPKGKSCLLNGSQEKIIYTGGKKLLDFCSLLLFIPMKCTCALCTFGWNEKRKLTARIRSVENFKVCAFCLYRIKKTENAFYVGIVLCSDHLVFISNMRD